MLGKLLKYDLKWTYKVVAVFYCLAFIFSIIAYFFNKTENSMLFDVLGQIANGFAISMAVSALVNCIMRSWARLVKNVYKDESYLTHTLPVSKGTIFSSKLLSAVLCTFTTIVVAAICIIICYYNEYTIVEWLKSTLEATANTFDSSIVGLLLVIFLVLVLEILAILFVGYAGIIIGHRFNKNKMLKSIIIAFAIYMASNILSISFLYVIGLFNPDIMNLVTTTDTISIDAFKAIMLYAIIIYTVLNVIYLLISKWQFNKGVNVD